MTYCHPLLDYRPWVATFILFVPSLRPIFKYLPYPAFAAAAILICAFIGYALLFGNSLVKKNLDRLLDSWWFTGLALALWALASFYIYPQADALKHVGRGSTADDAMIEPIMNWLGGSGLYATTLYDGAPVSPGPGWIWLNAPFSATGFYFLLIPFYLGLTALVYARVYADRAGANRVLLCLLPAPIFWQMLVTGHDLLAVGFVFALLVFLIEQFFIRSPARKNAAWIGLIVLLCGLVATSRIVFVCLPFLLGILLWRRSLGLAVLLALAGTAIALLLHGLFYWASEHYPPAHLFLRGERNVGFGLMALGGVFTALVGLVAVLRVRDNPDSRLFWFAVCLGTPLLFVSFGELRYVGLDFARWEGANYLIPVMPAVLFYLVRRRAFFTGEGRGKQ